MGPLRSGIRSFALTAFLFGLVIAAGQTESRGDFILYQTGFEPPAFTAGQPVNGQQGWIAAIGQQAGVITTTHPASGSQSLQVNGAGLEEAGGLFNGVYRPNNVAFDLTKNPAVLFQVDARLDGPQTGSSLADDLISVNFAVRAPTAALTVQSWISSNGHVMLHSGTDPILLGPAVSLGQYHTLGILFDSRSMTDSYYLDGAPIGTFSLPASFFTDTAVRFNDAMFAVPNAGTFNRADYTGYFDNHQVVAVPEPGSFTLTLAGLATVCLTARLVRRVALR